jgi:predicted peroxiredoxin
VATKLVIKLSHGPASTERVGQALTVGSTALASGLAVELWLMGDAVELTKPGAVEVLTLAHAPPLAELWSALREGGSVFACTQCMLRRGIAADALPEGVTQAGAPAFVASIAEDGARTIDF